MSKHVLFSKAYGRKESFSQLMLYPSYRYFVKAASVHIKQRRQPVLFAFDHVSLEINTHGLYERQELETFFAWIESMRPDIFRESIALDLGANIGNHSLFFSDYFREVHAFEPNERTFKVLELNAELVDNITCHHVGLSERTGTAFFRTNFGNIGASRVVPSRGSDVTEVNLDTLDSLVSGLADIKLIKVDVEGHDFEALTGAKETIMNHKPIIIFEHSAGDSEGGESAAVSLLKKYGYDKFAVIARHPRAPDCLSARLRLATEVCMRLFCGETMEVELIRSPHGDCSMVVAIPEWLNL